MGRGRRRVVTGVGVAVLAALSVVGPRAGAPATGEASAPKRSGAAHAGIDTRAVHAATVRDGGSFGFGTVFALGIGAERRLVSAAHVVDGVAFVPGDAAVFGAVPGADLAASTGGGSGSVGLLPAAEEVVAGDLVLVSGHPAGGALAVRRGRVVAVADGTTFGQRADVVVIDADVEPGFSGGPVVDAGGDVVAVMFAVEQRTGVGLAHPVGALSEPQVPTSSPASGAPSTTPS